MFSFRSLVCVVALTLSVSVDASSGGNNSPQSHSFDLAGSDLTRLYNSPVFQADRMKRPLDGLSSWMGPISHSGVRVTLQDGSQYLVHKGDGYGVSSQTVVTSARHMSPNWESVASRNFEGSKKVYDFVREGGSDYSLLFNNCHLGSRRMMGQ
ncbi:hypothetical protein JOB18_034980 [Solea senegalensis]|uniref:Uncharacterized protein n=1 Tax=Solea senegalensis TaxID=28829 RepID=A0AAV6PS94_SOLSE|nr:hypothetical protein JOB18_034980 [Solea senegalensis]